MIAMNKREREALIAKLQADTAATELDKAERKAAREARGEYFDDPIVTKHAHVHDFDVQAAIEEQLWQQRNYKTRAAPQPQATDNGYVTWRAMGEILDDVGELTGQLEKKLRTEEATRKKLAGSVARELTTFHDDLNGRIKELRREVKELKTELALVKALARGEVRMIEDMRDAKAS